ncbi:MAG: hypothetical protein H7A23_14140 [Leptospiraceae bacterium]|nr:hypothetical protein [Leptospiraceae bacterium]MCP5495690.1 hypothetical protein [Leptospiraceae bacterium]
MGQTDTEKTKKLNVQAQVVTYLAKQISDYKVIEPVKVGKASGNCTDSQPSFSSLANAGSTTNCGRCHNSSLYKGDMDISDYSSVSSVSVSGDPETSTIYRVIIPNGQMYKYTTQALNDTIYCWIKGGLQP